MLPNGRLEFYLPLCRRSACKFWKSGTTGATPATPFQPSPETSLCVLRISEHRSILVSFWAPKFSSYWFWRTKISHVYGKPRRKGRSGMVRCDSRNGCLVKFKRRAHDSGRFKSLLWFIFRLFCCDVTFGQRFEIHNCTQLLIFLLFFRLIYFSSLVRLKL